MFSRIEIVEKVLSISYYIFFNSMGVASIRSLRAVIYSISFGFDFILPYNS